MPYKTYFYYEPADLQACQEDMGGALAEWFPEVAEECKGPMWNYHGWAGDDFEALVSALEEAGELSRQTFRRLGTRMGPPGSHCNCLH